MSNISNPLLRVQSSDKTTEEFCGISEKELQDYIVQAHIFRLKKTAELQGELISMIRKEMPTNEEALFNLLSNVKIMQQSPFVVLSEFLKSDIDCAIIRRVQSGDLDTSVYVSLTCEEHFLEHFKKGLELSGDALNICMEQKSTKALEKMHKEALKAVAEFEAKGYDAFLDDKNPLVFIKKMLDMLGDGDEM